MYRCIWVLGTMVGAVRSSPRWYGAEGKVRNVTSCSAYRHQLGQTQAYERSLSLGAK